MTNHDQPEPVSTNCCPLQVDRRLAGGRAPVRHRGPATSSQPRLSRSWSDALPGDCILDRLLDWRWSYLDQNPWWPNISTPPPLLSLDWEILMRDSFTVKNLIRFLDWTYVDQMIISLSNDHTTDSFRVHIKMSKLWNDSAFKYSYMLSEICDLKAEIFQINQKTPVT